MQWKIRFLIKMLQYLASSQWLSLVHVHVHVKNTLRNTNYLVFNISIVHLNEEMMPTIVPFILLVLPELF